jgi:hypothetical protein
LLGMSVPPCCRFHPKKSRSRLQLRTRPPELRTFGATDAGQPTHQGQVLGAQGPAVAVEQITGGLRLKSLMALKEYNNTKARRIWVTFSDSEKTQLQRL